MGHIVNPISLRLGVSKYWNSTWAVSNLKGSYSYMANQDIFIQEVFWTLFHRRFGLLNNILKNLMPAGIHIVRSYKTVSLFCDFYYTNSAALRYVLFSFFSKFFSLEYLKSVASKGAFSLTKGDLALYAQFKEHFLLWSWYKVIKPIQLKYWLSLKQALTVIFSRLYQRNQVVKVYVRSINEQQITANFLARFIATRLEQGVAVRKVLGMIQSALSKLVADKVLLGFRIKLTGRFSRIQQASCSVSSGGVLGRNESNTNVDYAFQTANLKFSVCGIKVLLARPLMSSLSVENAASSKENLNTWLQYVPSSNYSRWQKEKLQTLLTEGSNKDLKNSGFSLYI